MWSIGQHVWGQKGGLELDLLESILPECKVWRGAVLAVVEEEDHAIGVHGLADEELVVLEVGNNYVRV